MKLCFFTLTVKVAAWGEAIVAPTNRSEEQQE